MNHFLAWRLGAFTRWMLKGFKGTFEETYKDGEMYLNFFSKNAVLGYVTAFVLVIAIGSILKVTTPT